MRFRSARRVGAQPRRSTRRAAAARGRRAPPAPRRRRAGSASARGRAAARTPRARRRRGAPSGCPWRARSPPRRSSAVSSWSTFSCSWRRLAVAAHRDLDRALHGLRVVGLDVAPRCPCSAARATKSTSSRPRTLGDHRARTRTRPPRRSAPARARRRGARRRSRGRGPRGRSARPPRATETANGVTSWPSSVEHVAERLAAPPRPRRRAGSADCVSSWCPAGASSSRPRG